MKYILYGSLTSPYVRKLRLLFLTHNIEHELKLINYLEKNDSDLLKSINPINKIPILVDKEAVIYDSRVIYNYISHKHQITKLNIQEENLLSAIDGALDTSINLFSLRRGGLDLDSGNSYIERQKERVPLILDFLTPYAKSLDAQKNADWNFVSMSLYSYLFWGTFREIVDLKSYPDLTRFLENFKNAPGVNDTIPK